MTVSQQAIQSSQPPQPLGRTHCARVVLGPRTRLGQSLISQAAAAGHDVHAVARDDRDASALAAGPATVVRVDSQRPLLADTAWDSLHVYVCALGPVHPTEPDTDAEAVRVARDLAVVTSLLDSAAGRPVHVVLVSSVIALAPGEDRRYYGGWKALVEQELRSAVHQHAGAELCVLYPGRLVDDHDSRRPWTRAHTSYARLAGVVEEAGTRPRSRVVGLDARAWLVARGASLALASLSGSRGVLRRREGLSPRERTERQVSQ